MRRSLPVLSSRPRRPGPASRSRSPARSRGTRCPATSRFDTAASASRTSTTWRCSRAPRRRACCGSARCLRIYRRPDNTVITSDCRARLRAARKRGLLVFAGALLVVLWAQICAQFVGLMGLKRLIGGGATMGEPAPMRCRARSRRRCRRRRRRGPRHAADDGRVRAAPPNAPPDWENRRAARRAVMMGKVAIKAGKTDRRLECAHNPVVRARRPVLGWARLRMDDDARRDTLDACSWSRLIAALCGGCAAVADAASPNAGGPCRRRRSRRAASPAPNGRRRSPTRSCPG